MASKIHSTADVSKNARIGMNTSVWNNAQVRENAKIGSNCILGKNVYIDHGVEIGNNVKVQNNSSIYYMTTIEDGIFIGPHVIITNDKTPRAIDAKGNLKTDKDWEAEKNIIKEGASIGAGSIILPGLKIGKFAMVGAGSVVTKDVPDYGLVYGNPAKLAGYACKCGSKITKIEERGSKLSLYCSKCKEKITTKKQL